MVVTSQLVQRRMCVHIIPNFGADRLVASLGEGSRKTCNNENASFCTKYFNSNDFEYSLAAISTLAGFQNTFLRTLQRAEHEIVVEIE